MRLHDVADAPSVAAAAAAAKDAAMAPSQKDARRDCQPSRVGRKASFHVRALLTLYASSLSST